MKWFYSLRMVYKILLPVSITLVLVLGLMAWQIQYKSAEIVQKVAERELVALGEVYSNQVYMFINDALTTTIEVANTISTIANASTNFSNSPLSGSVPPLSREQIIALLLSAINTDKFISSSLALLPTSQDALYVNTLGSDENGQFYPYVSDAGVKLLDKNEFDSPYFTVPQKTKKPYISDPFFYKSSTGKDRLITTVSAPIIVDNVFKGVTLLDFELALLNKMTETIQVYTTGGISILSQGGTILSHNNPKLISVNMFDLERWKNNQEFKNTIKDGKSYLSLATMDGVENFFYFHPFVFPQTGQVMYVCVMVPLAEVLAEVAELTNITLIASIFALLVLLLVTFFSVRSSIKPLAMLATAADEVANGNFDVKIDARTFGGEVLDLKSSIDAMLVSLVENISKAEALGKDAQEQTLKAQEAMKEADLARDAAESAKREGMLAAATQLEGVVSIISAASEQLSTQVEQAEHASLRQSERMAETATAMEEMNSTVLEVAQSASTASDISSQARTCAENGTQIVKMAVLGIESVQAVSLALKEDMNVLAGKAKAISEIMNVISDIADQTNLLALNAAIEAARAGEAGRGFAVVADEVRKLAEKTMASTTDVGNAIQSIQTSVDASIRQVDKAVKLIGEATEQSTQSGISLSEIMTLVDTTADQVRAIATASEEQSATSEEINRAITEINDLSEQSAQGMRESASAVHDLTEQAHALSTLIEEMKQG